MKKIQNFAMSSCNIFVYIVSYDKNSRIKTLTLSQRTQKQKKNQPRANKRMADKMF